MECNLIYKTTLKFRFKAYYSPKVPNLSRIVNAFTLVFTLVHLTEEFLNGLETVEWKGNQ